MFVYIPGMYCFYLVDRSVTVCRHSSNSRFFCSTAALCLCTLDDLDCVQVFIQPALLRRFWSLNWWMLAELVWQDMSSLGLREAARLVLRLVPDNTNRG